MALQLSPDHIDKGSIPSSKYVTQNHIDEILKTYNYAYKSMVSR